MQRNIFSFIFLLISVVVPLQSLALQYSFSYTYEGQTVKYRINNDGITCKTVDCYSERAHDIKGKLILPSHPKDEGGREYILTAIGYESFYDNDKLTSVEIPNTVTTIGHFAFQNCDQLSQVKLPETLKSIGSCSFSSCISLTSIYVPESVENISPGAFGLCTNLSTINLPDKLTKIWFGTFEGCSSLTSIVIPNLVKEIEYDAFQNCSGLKTVIIGPSVSTVGKNAFNGCSPVKFGYPNTLSENPFGDFGSTAPTLGAYNPDGAIIENGWIYGPDKKEIRFAPYDLAGDYIIPDTIESIGTSAFANCRGITSITIPNSLQVIDDFAFYNCSGIDSCSLVIPRSVYEIGNRAFYNCSFINIIVGRTPSDGPYRINRQSFSGCRYEKYAYSYGMGNPFTPLVSDPEFGSYDSNGAIIENGWIFGPDKKEIRYAPYELEGEYVIPETVTSIGDNAFSLCHKLTRVIGTNSITRVGKWAFYACGITSIELPSVKYIGVGAFKSCKVKSMSLGWGITDILNETFASSGLTYLDIPNSVTQIYESAFANCINLTSILIPNSVTKIGNSAFHNTGLKSVVIPNSITKLGVEEFDTCKDLSEIVIGNSIEDIYYYGGVPVTLYITATEAPSLMIKTPSDPLWKREKLYIPENSASSYQNGYWNIFKEREFLVEATGLSLNASSIKGHAGDTFQLSAMIEPSNVTLPYVFWKSTNPEIAIVDNQGLVTLVKDVLDDNRDSNGINKCKIICETLYANTPIAVAYIGEPDLPQPQSIEWVQDFNDVTVGNSFELSATATSGLAVEYTSSDTNLATIENGIVTFIAPGTVTLTALQAGNEKYLPAQSINISVNIKPLSVKELYLDHSERNCKVGDSFILSATVMPENATDKSISWTSSDPDVATVDENGSVKAVKVGECIVTATATDGSDVSASCKVTVSPYLAESIELDYSERNCKVGDSFILSATVLPENATDKSISWTSSHPDVATVDENGTVTAVNVGECVVTATAADDSDISASCKVTVSPYLAESIELDYSERNCKVGDSFILSATVMPENATDKSISWTSSDPDVATVDENGTVTAVNVGECVVTATAADDSDISASCKVTVLPRLAESIELDYSERNCKVGDSFILSATVMPENTTDKSISWSSSDPDVATVDKNGSVKAVKVGECIVTATAADGSDVSASCKITVSPYLAESIELDYSERNCKVGDSFILSATVLPENATDKSISWTSSDPDVATVDENGSVKAVNVGECIVTATAADGSDVSASCKITVSLYWVESIELDYSERHCKAGDSFVLYATVLPENATDKSISWTSSDPEVATVDENGSVKAVNVGECIVTATATDGSDISAQCTVIVHPMLIESITLDCSEWNGFPGESFTILATVNPDNATDKTVFWNSSDPEVATVDETGLVSAVKPGSALITAITSNGLTATCEVTVLPILVESITLDPNTIQGIIGEEFVIKASVLPEDASNPDIYWESGNTNVATVDQDGNVKINGEGLSRIFAYATDGSNVSGDCIILGTSGIESILTECGNNISIYTPSGLLIKKDCTPEDLKNLLPGIYIFKSEKKTVSVMIH